MDAVEIGVREGVEEDGEAHRDEDQASILDGSHLEAKGFLLEVVEEGGFVEDKGFGGEVAGEDVAELFTDEGRFGCVGDVLGVREDRAGVPLVQVFAEVEMEALLHGIA